MDDLLRISHDERRAFFQEAAAGLGLEAAIIEKDFWVCWALRELFRMPGWGDHLVFKGGTSLSKGWKLIRRFSEDVDVVISREKLGFPGDHSLSNRQLKNLRECCREAVQRDVAAGLRQAIASADQGVDLYADDADPDGQTLLLAYPRHFASSENYLRPTVKIEMGARSDTWPAEEIRFPTMLFEALPHAVEPVTVSVKALSPLRTFWEKAMLLHEENDRPADKKRKARMARHYYDLWCLIRAGIGKSAAQDRLLFEAVADHRRVFFRQSWVDYSTLRPGSLRLVPSAESMDDWEQDYGAMRSFFFPDEAPPAWSEIIGVAADFERSFNESA